MYKRIIELPWKLEIRIERSACTYFSKPYTYIAPFLSFIIHMDRKHQYPNFLGYYGNISVDGDFRVYKYYEFRSNYPTRKWNIHLLFLDTTRKGKISFDNVGEYFLQSRALFIFEKSNTNSIHREFKENLVMNWFFGSHQNKIGNCLSQERSSWCVGCFTSISRSSSLVQRRHQR